MGAILSATLNAYRLQRPPLLRFEGVQSAFQRVRGRGKDAWLIRPGSYFLLPYRQAFASEFRADFAIMLTLRPTEESEVRE